MNKTSNRQSKDLRSDNNKRTTKYQIYKTLVRSVLLYGSEKKTFSNSNVYIGMKVYKA